MVVFQTAESLEGFGIGIRVGLGMQVSMLLSTDIWKENSSGLVAKLKSYVFVTLGIRGQFYETNLTVNSSLLKRNLHSTLKTTIASRNITSHHVM